MLRNCLRSIERETTSPYELIIIDNASNDDSCTMIRRDFPYARLIVNESNLGFAKANNQGLRIAEGEYVLFLNPDTLILDGALDKMVAFLRDHPHIGIVGPHTLNADGVTTQATALYQPSLWRAFHAHIPLWRLVPFWKPAVLGEYIPECSRPVEVVKGSCMLMRTDLVRAIGGMNEQYFMYAEEIDLCEAVRKQNLLVYYYTGARIVHFGGASTEAVSEEMVIHLYRSTKKLFARRYQSSVLILQALRVILMIGSIWRLIAWTLLTFIGNTSQARIKQRHHRAILRWLLYDYT